MSKNPYESPRYNLKPQRLRVQRLWRTLRIVAGAIATAISFGIITLGIISIRRGMSPEFANASFNPLPMFGIFACGLGAIGLIVGYFLLRIDRMP